MPGTVQELEQSLDELLTHFFPYAPSFLLRETEFDRAYIPRLEKLAEVGGPERTGQYVQAYQDAFEFVSLLNMNMRAFEMFAREARQHWDSIAGIDAIYARKVADVDSQLLKERQYAPTQRISPLSGKVSQPVLPKLSDIARVMPSVFYLNEDPQQIKNNGQNLTFHLSSALKYLGGDSKRYDGLQVFAAERETAQGRDLLVALRLPVHEHMSDVTPHSHYWRTFVTLPETRDFSLPAPPQSLQIMREIDYLIESSASPPVLVGKPTYTHTVSFPPGRPQEEYLTVGLPIHYMGQTKVVPITINVAEKQFLREYQDQASLLMRHAQEKESDLSLMPKSCLARLTPHLPSFL